jgi:hypothetical protein
MTRNGRKNLSIVLYIVLIAVLLIGCSDGAKGTTNIEPKPAEQDNDVTASDVNTDGQAIEPVPQPEPEPVIEEQPKFVSPYNFEYPDAVRGIYLTSHSAGGSRFNTLVDLINTTDLNAMVIDIKDDHGYITFPLDESSPYHVYSKKNIADIHALMKSMEENKIYPIARIVVFKDTVASEAKPEWSFLDNGKVWHNNREESFVNPFLKEVWEYNVEIAKLAAEVGFKEIQFDYVRFPEGFENRDEKLKYSLGEYEGKKPAKLYELEEAYKTDIVVYEKNMNKLVEQREAKQVEVNAKENAVANQATDSSATTNQASTDSVAAEQLKAFKQELADIDKQIKELEKKQPVEPNYTPKETAVQLRVDAITDFVAYAKEELKGYDVDVSVDIFGYTATISEAPGIGQNFSKISNNVDVICSMIYPSHWGFNYFGIPKPDLEPYRLVKEYITKESEVLAGLDNPPVSRPWIQDFTAPWLKPGNYKQYGKQDIEDQIKALNESGVWEYLIWNAGNKYTPGVNYLPIGARQ